MISSLQGRLDMVGMVVWTRTFSIAASLLVATPVGALERRVSAAGAEYVMQGLVGVGRIAASTRDAFGETSGSGSGMAIEPGTWRKTDNGYAGSFFLLPDRGYNVEGTTDYRARLQKLDVRFSPLAPGASGVLQNQVEAKINATILLTDEKGESMSGLDPVAVRPATASFPLMPQAVNGRVSLDPEAIGFLPDGSILISDEYGPYNYRFSREGKLLSAFAPPQSFLPMRKGKVDFSSNNPGPGAPVPDPRNPETGRQNNQGFEGTAITPDGKFAVQVLQSATRQDGGDDPSTRNFTRALVWDMTEPATPKLAHEYVVPLPTFKDAKGATLVAAQSELVALDNKRFLILCRDSNNGLGVKGDVSLYRWIEILDLSEATDIAGTEFDGLKPVAPKGVLAAGITPAKLTPFIDINASDDLERFGLHNGLPRDRNMLSEKWESMALASALDPERPNDWFLFVANDNDFITLDGYQVGAAYKDQSGSEVDTMFFVYRLTLPAVAK